MSESDGFSSLLFSSLPPAVSLSLSQTACFMDFVVLVFGGQQYIRHEEMTECHADRQRESVRYVYEGFVGKRQRGSARERARTAKEKTRERD